MTLNLRWQKSKMPALTSLISAPRGERASHPPTSRAASPTGFKCHTGLWVLLLDPKDRRSNRSKSRLTPSYSPLAESETRFSRSSDWRRMWLRRERRSSTTSVSELEWHWRRITWDMGHFFFNASEQEKLDMINQELYQNMDSKRNFPMPGFISHNDNFPIPTFTKTPTGVWNPIKQEIEKLPRNQSTTYPGFIPKFQSSGARFPKIQEKAYAEISPEGCHNGPGAFPEIQGTSNLLSHNIQASKTTSPPTQGKISSGKHLSKLQKIPFAMEMALDLKRRKLRPKPIYGGFETTND